MEKNDEWMSHDSCMNFLFFVLWYVYLIKHRKYAHTHTFYGKQEKKQNKDKHHQTVHQWDRDRWFEVVLKR